MDKSEDVIKIGHFKDSVFVILCVIKINFLGHSVFFVFLLIFSFM